MRASDGHDFPGLIDERVPGVAAVVDDFLEGFEDAVRQPIRILIIEGLDRHLACCEHVASIFLQFSLNEARSKCRI
jgi:hypothetical protein